MENYLFYFYRTGAVYDLRRPMDFELIHFFLIDVNICKKKSDLNRNRSCQLI